MARHSDKRGEQRSKPRTVPQQERAMLDSYGQPRGSVDGPPGKDILDEYGKDISGIQTFVGRTMRGDFRRKGK
jgi:hypothetical protein